MLKVLPSDVQSKLRSHVAITSVAQCVEELVLNSLDAGAVCIAIRIDMTTLTVQIVDNGTGISFEDLKLIGERYSTSKCQKLADLDNLEYFGYRGEALASLRDITTALEIHSRSRQSSMTFCKLFRQGKPVKVADSKYPRPCPGTTVTLHNLFYNLPVRQKNIYEGLELEQIRYRVEGISLINPSISFSLRNDATGHILLQTQKSNSVLTAFMYLFGGNLSKHLKPVSINRDPFRIEGYLSKDGHNRKTLQFVYVNSRLVLKTQVHKMVNRTMSNCIYFRKKKSQEMRNSVAKTPPRGIDKHPIYVINIKCPLNIYDITFDPRKTLVEFKDWETLTSAVETMVTDFLKRENLWYESALNKSTEDIGNGDVETKEHPLGNTEEEEMDIDADAKVSEISTSNTTNSLFSKTVYRQPSELENVPKTPSPQIIDVSTPDMAVNEQNHSKESSPDPQNIDSQEALEEAAKKLNIDLSPRKKVHFVDDERPLNGETEMEAKPQMSSSSSDLTTSSSDDCLTEDPLPVNVRQNHQLTPTEQWYDPNPEFISLPSDSEPFSILDNLRDKSKANCQKSLTAAQKISLKLKERHRIRAPDSEKESKVSKALERFRKKSKHESRTTSLQPLEDAAEKVLTSGAEIKLDNRQDALMNVLPEDNPIIHLAGNNNNNNRNILQPSGVSFICSDRKRMHDVPIITEPKKSKFMTSESFVVTPKTAFVQVLPLLQRAQKQTKAIDIENQASYYPSAETIHREETPSQSRTSTFLDTTFKRPLPVDHSRRYTTSKFSPYNHYTGQTRSNTTAEVLKPINGKFHEVVPEDLSVGSRFQTRPSVTFVQKDQTIEPSQGFIADITTSNKSPISKISESQGFTVDDSVRDPDECTQQKVDTVSKSDSERDDSSYVCGMTTSLLDENSLLNDVNRSLDNGQSFFSESESISKEKSLAESEVSEHQNDVYESSTSMLTQEVSKSIQHSKHNTSMESSYPSSQNSLTVDSIRDIHSDKSTNVTGHHSNHTVCYTEIPLVSTCGSAIESVTQSLKLSVETENTKNNYVMNSQCEPETIIDSKKSSTVHGEQNQNVVKAVSETTLTSSYDSQTNNSQHCMKNISIIKTNTNEPPLGMQSEQTSISELSIKSTHTSDSELDSSIHCGQKRNSNIPVLTSDPYSITDILSDLSQNIVEDTVSSLSVNKPVSSVSSSQHTDSDGENVTNTCTNQGSATSLPDITEASQEEENVPKASETCSSDGPTAESTSLFTDEIWMEMKDKNSGKTIHVNKLTGNTVYEKEWLILQQNISKSGFSGSTSLCYGKNSGTLPPLCNSDNDKLYSMLTQFLDNDNEDRSVKWRTRSDTETDTGNCMIDDMFNQWQNPVHEKNNQCGISTEVNHTSRSAILSYQSLNHITFTKHMLTCMQVLGQVDSKFIACLISSISDSSKTVPDLLVMMDQHAAHERVRLEQYISEIFEDNEDESDRIKRSEISPPLSLTLRKEDIRVMTSFKQEFNRIGVVFKCNENNRNEIYLHTIPSCIVEREANELKRGKSSITSPFVEELITEHLEYLKNTKGSRRRLPLALQRILATKACRGAIKFNDNLSKEQCKELITALSKCDLPFQCAHGRPSVIPLFKLDNKLYNHKQVTRKPRLDRLKTDKSLLKK